MIRDCISGNETMGRLCRFFFVRTGYASLGLRKSTVEFLA